MLTHFHSFPSFRPVSVDVQETVYLSLKYLQVLFVDSAAILWADGVDPQQENRVRSLSSWKQEVQQVVN